MMYIALTYDHRLVDGREAVTFLRWVPRITFKLTFVLIFTFYRTIKNAVEDPRIMLMDL